MDEPPKLLERAQCQTHSLFYDARQHSGCVVCRREGRPEDTSPGPSAAAIWSFVALVMGGLGALAVYVGGNKAPARAPAPVSADERAIPEVDAKPSAPGAGQPVAQASTVTAVEDPNAQDDQGWTPLMRAVQEGDVERVRSLLLGRPALEVTCERGMTALAHAAEAPLGTPVLMLLLRAGAGVDARDLREATPLMHAAGAGNAASVKALLERGALLNTRDSRGYSALDYLIQPREPLSEAQRAERRELLQQLLGAGIERRLGTNTAYVQILLRDELNSVALREGRSPLPEYVAGQLAAGPGAASTSVAATETKGESVGSLRLWSGQPRMSTRYMPPRPKLEALMTHRGWTRVPNVTQRVELAISSLPSGQSVYLSSNREGTQAFTVDDALLIELYAGKVLARVGYIGYVEQFTLDSKPVARLLPAGARFEPGALDMTPFFLSGATRMVLTALDWGGWSECTPLYLNVRGGDPARTLRSLQLR